jgi:hypothetical protein
MRAFMVLLTTHTSTLLLPLPTITSSAGSYWQADRHACRKCPPDTFWPGTGFGKTQLLETDECIPCSGLHKLGATSCPSYAKHTAMSKKNAVKKTKE